jgi:DNA repair protein RecO (recombination protein O)
MLHSTRGIVIHTSRYSETSVIARIYTEVFGLQSYLVKGVHKSRSKFRPGLFQPLNILELEVYHKQKSSLQSIREANYLYPYQTISFDIRKSSVALFINELTYKTIHEEEANSGLFEFLLKSCIDLDTRPAAGNYFHLIFALQLTKHLGFMPQKNYSSSRKIFNLQEGLFQEEIPDHPYFMNKELSAVFFQFLSDPPDSGESIRISAKVRDLLLETILNYFKLHVPGFTGMKSHLVLHTVLS